MASRPNPTSIKSRSSRLQAFARGRTTSAPEDEMPEKRTNTPHANGPADVPIPTRETSSEEPKMTALSKVLRTHPLARSPQQPNGKALRTNGREPSPELGEAVSGDDKTHRSLFEGSHLGDNFMESGLTTPQNEIERPYLDNFGGKGLTRHMDNGDTQEHAPAFLRYEEKGVPHFQWTEDGYMVVKSGLGRQSPSQMKDGFQDGGIEERKNQHWRDRYRVSAPADRSKNLPIREVKVRKSRATARDDQVPGVKRRSRSPSSGEPARLPAYLENTRGTSMVINLDDDVGSLADQDILQETPKAKKTKAAPPEKGLMESSVPPAMNLNRHVQTKKRSRASPDYDDMALSNMRYTDLQAEPFDLDPAQAAMQNSYGGDADALSKKLDQLKQQSEREQRAFFSNLSMEDWEQSGDWFVDRFSELMKKLRDARRNKRQMIREFEAEASKHEEAVRRRSEAIDQKLVKMRQDGQRVVGDKGC
ncbi:hypothetical protein ACRE_020080 [Hapsidospora chrysogenum ATCC 11550]|uniref:Extracellular mutant protein 11 C-terminal domain-containing protein n=1 Tax=Hapsidospora chrysogenum (strain ATCC 11550 / CBS 779.69 / DSM 880 / IAM 14645 / JCM 23072 / IMI 49137) TaxID=857340 RepID=A0A086TCS6_HAPC1|nr:hypothetical protein ACRE_020080 [Hapsidospora chrysogenum ATCC 11550]